MTRKKPHKKALYFVFVFISTAITGVNAFETTFNTDVTIDNSYIKSDFFSENVIRGLINVGFETNLTNFLGKESFFSASYALQHGDNGSDISGDIQGFSNIDATDFNHAYEVILGIKLGDTSFVKLGQMDANSDFATTKYGGEFINSSMGFSPTIQGIPTYPQPSIGIYAEYKMNSSVTTRLGYYESSAKYNHFDDFFSIAEAQWHYQSNSSVKLGVWHHSGLEGEDLVSQSSNDIYFVIYWV